uniref:HTH CENPB-type domain-containing protein n=1 Tax=Erpetoichthys calabaricus TaxID=27687 RepID=A0A8C4SGZ7_ERPCA
MSGSSAGVKRKRVVLSIATKLQIVECAEKGESIAKLSSEFNIGNQTVRDNVRKKDELYKFVTSSDTFNGTSVRKTTKGSKFDDLDRAVFEWFKQKRGKGCPLSGPLLLKKVKWFHCEMKIPEPFAASQGWLQCFKSRHGIRQLDIQGEKLSGDSDAAVLYVTEFKRLVEAHDLSPDQLCNADENGLYWKALPSKMLVSKEERSAAGHKSIKERITVLACTNASGLHKLKLGTQMRNFPVLYYNQTKAWMNREIFKDWFLNVLFLLFETIYAPKICHKEPCYFWTTVENVNDSESQEITAASLLEEIQNVNGFEDIEEWLLSENVQPGYQVKDDAAIAAEAKSSAELPEESDDDAVEDEPSEKKVSLAEALNCAKTLLDFLEQEADSNFIDILTLRKLHTSIKLKCCKNTKQRLLKQNPSLEWLMACPPLVVNTLHHPQFHTFSAKCR